MRLGLRAQLLIVSSLLLALPLLGLRSAREIEAFLVETQEQGLAATARAVATALNERPFIFTTDAGAKEEPGPGVPLLRIETLSAPITIDGGALDWSAQRGETREVTAPSPAGAAVSPLRLRYRLGRYERNIYALIEVRDDAVIRYDSEFPRLDLSDYVEIAVVTADDEFLRFAIHESGDGSARVTRINADGSETPDARVDAALLETDEGYRIEARLLRTMVG